MVTGRMLDRSESMTRFLGVAADSRLLDQDRFNLPASEQSLEAPVLGHEHDRLVIAGSTLTTVSLVAGVLLLLYGGSQVVVDGGGVVDLILVLLGVLLAATHWGWVHVAEYVGLTIDERHERSAEERRRDWLSSIQPYPRFSVSTLVLDDGSIRIERVLHQPVMTEQHTFTFVRKPDAVELYDADVAAAVIASAAETMRRRARLDTDRLRNLWETASTAYAAELSNADDEQQRSAAHRAAATALSEHINASLREPPLVE
jgi:hypothetical protein